MSVVVGKQRILGFPVRLEDAAYARNALMFNVGFILDPHAQWRSYVSVLRKLASVLASMEREQGFLRRDAQGHAAMGLLLDEVFAGLSSRGECVVPVLAGTTLALKLFPVLQGPVVVGDHDVPVRVKDLDALAGEDWDMCLRRVLPLIDGVTHTGAIAEAADVEPHLVRRVVEHMLHYGFVGLVDLFQYSNVYAITPAACDLLSPAKAELAAAAVQYATAQGSSVVPDAADIFRVLVRFGTGTRVQDVVVGGRTAECGIDDRALVVFGVLHGLLRRMHAHATPLTPVATQATRSAGPGTVAGAQSEVSASAGGEAGAGAVVGGGATPPTSTDAVDGSEGGHDAKAVAGSVAPPMDSAPGGNVLRLPPALWRVRHLLGGGHCLDEVCCAAHMSYSAVHSALTQGNPPHFAIFLR